MKQINVIKENCIGCGACVAIDPEHFEFNDEGKSSVISNEDLESANLTNAIESCPTSAIELQEVETKEQEEMTEQTICECGENCDHEECVCTECDCDVCDCEHHKEENEENNEN